MFLSKDFQFTLQTSDDQNEQRYPLNKVSQVYPTTPVKNRSENFWPFHYKHFLSCKFTSKLK